MNCRMQSLLHAVLIVDKPSVCQRICPTACLRTAHALRRRGVPWLRTALRSVCSPLQPFGPSTDSDRDGNAFFPTVRNRRSTSHAKRACGSCGSLGLLRPVSATGGGLRAHPQFAMVVLLRLTACSTPLLTGLTSACFAHSARPSCAPQKMPEMTYTPSFLIRASFFRYFVNTLEISLPFGPRGAIFPKWKKFLPKWQDALQRG